MIKFGVKPRTASLIAVLVGSLAGCKSADEKPKGPPGVYDAEAVQKQKDLERDKFVEALGSTPEGLGKTMEPR